jgi:hypothetical protein
MSFSSAKEDRIANRSMEFRSSGVQEFRSSGGVDHKMARKKGSLLAVRKSCPALSIMIS